MIIIADSSPLIALAACQELGLLELLYSEVKVPQSVFDEVTIVGKGGAEILYHFLKDKVVDVDLSNHLLSSHPLGKGELEAMALYQKLHATKLLIDDRAARKVAKQNNINIIGSLGILLLAKNKGIIPELASRIQSIIDSKIFLSPSLVEHVLKASGELP